MSDDLSEEHPGMIDDDPALDIILLDEMEKEARKTPKQSGGCAGVLIVLIMPVGMTIYMFYRFLSF